MIGPLKWPDGPCSVVSWLSKAVIMVAASVMVVILVLSQRWVVCAVHQTLATAWSF